MTLLLGIDLSTTGAKALLIDDEGRVVSSATTPLTLSTPHALWSEQNPEDWWQATLKSVASVIASANATSESIAAIGLTGQMHGLVLLDHEGRVLRPAILWNDQRCGVECDEIRERVGREKLLRTTGNDALTGFTAPKILWVEKHEPEIYRRIRHVLLPKDYIRYKLTGAHAMDKADGSGTMLFDLGKRTWAPEILKSLNVSPEWLPPTFEGHETTGEVSTGSSRTDRFTPWNSCRRRWRRSVCAGDGRGCRASWHDRSDTRNIGSRVCRDRNATDRTTRTTACFLSCRFRPMALDGGDAECGGKSSVVPR